MPETSTFIVTGIIQPWTPNDDGSRDYGPAIIKGIWDGDTTNTVYRYPMAGMLEGVALRDRVIFTADERAELEPINESL